MVIARKTLEQKLLSIKWLSLGVQDSRAGESGFSFSLHLNVRVLPAIDKFESKWDKRLGELLSAGFHYVKLSKDSRNAKTGNECRVLMRVDVDYRNREEIPESTFNALLELEERIPQLFTADEVSLVHF